MGGPSQLAFLRLKLELGKRRGLVDSWDVLGTRVGDERERAWDFVDMKMGGECLRIGQGASEGDDSGSEEMNCNEDMSFYVRKPWVLFIFSYFIFCSRYL